MSTRGIMGVRVNGQDKLTYNHFDSYPEELGESIVGDLRSHDLSELKKKALNLRLVGDNDLSFEIEVEEIQGEFAKTLEAGVTIDSYEFIDDSLFCEWAYVANFDDNRFEVYRGFQKKQHERGRYAIPKYDAVAKRLAGDTEYYPCALIAEFPLDDIPRDWAKQVKEMVKQEEV